MSYVAGTSMPHHARDAELPYVGLGSVPHTWHTAVPLGLDSPMPYTRLAELPYVDCGSVPHTRHAAVPLGLDSPMPHTRLAELPYVARASMPHHARDADLPAWVTQQQT